MRKRVPLWQRRTTAKARVKRASLWLGSVLLLWGFGWMCFDSYREGWWPVLLDWVVVAIPTVAGIWEWVLPMTQVTTSKRVIFLVGGISLSGLIYLQQWNTNKTHASELAKLATKEDLATLPTVEQIGLEFRRVSTEMTPVSPPVRSSSPKPSVTTAPAPSESGDRISKGLEEIKSMLGSQQWGLPAESLVKLSREMAPFASTVNGWSGGGDLMTSILGNPDSNKLATSLVAALRAAGWNLPGSGMSLSIFSGNPEGVIFVLHSKEDATLPVVNQFAGILKDAGIAFHGEVKESVPAGQFRLIIGAKP